MSRRGVAAWATLVGLLLIGLVSLLAACTTGDGEGPRYIGRVISVDAHEICVGPSSSSAEITCGKVPLDPPTLPKVGDCVGLFPKGGDGADRTWSSDSISRKYQDADCDG